MKMAPRHRVDTTLRRVRRVGFPRETRRGSFVRLVDPAWVSPPFIPWGVQPLSIPRELMYVVERRSRHHLWLREIALNGFSGKG